MTQVVISRVVWTLALVVSLYAWHVLDVASKRAFRVLAEEKACRSASGTRAEMPYQSGVCVDADGRLFAMPRIGVTR